MDLSTRVGGPGVVAGVPGAGALGGKPRAARAVLSISSLVGAQGQPQGGQDQDGPLCCDDGKFLISNYLHTYIKQKNSYK